MCKRGYTQSYFSIWISLESIYPINFMMFQIDIPHILMNTWKGLGWEQGENLTHCRMKRKTLLQMCVILCWTVPFKVNKNYCLQWCLSHEPTVYDKWLMSNGRGEAKVWGPCNMNPCRKIVPFCNRPPPLPQPHFCQLARTVIQLSFGSRSTFQLNLVQVYEPICKLCAFLQ